MARFAKMAAIAGIAALTLTSSAYAGAGWEFTTPGNSYTNGQWDFATAFTVNSNVVLSGLGYYADPVTGNVDGNPVAFYECDDVSCSTTGTLLVSTTVTNTYPETGHFRYVTIAPITLLAGQSYEVAGVSNADNYTWNDTGFTVDPSISIITDGTSTPDMDRWAMIGTPDFLNSIHTGYIPGQDGFWGPDVFLGTPSFVPEPASMALLGAGLAGLGLVRRKRSQ